MQLLPRYLLKNRVNIVADLAGFVVEYRPVYQRTVQIYRGIDNVVEFRLLNADQKPVNTQGYIPKFVAFDENQNLIIEHDGVVLDDGSSATKGLFTVTITENDLLNVKQQFLSYNIYLVDVNNNKIISYTDTHFGNNGIIKVSTEAFPGVKASKVITNFVRLDSELTEYVSDAVEADPSVNNNEALHTAAVYASNYQGNIIVQGTLENQVTDFTNWAEITALTFTGTETEPTPVNFSGVYKFVRFKTTQEPTNKVTKILVRN